MADPALDRYRSKRHFDRTAEPSGDAPGEPRTSAADEGPTFVVQKHAARALHYDVRFEVDGVMPSWAVPKGPSYDPKVKRLAMHVEDHPLDYQEFEGTIAAGEYGGGAVIVWDRGTYRNITEHRGRPVPMREAIDRGHVSVWMEGTKLRGGWSMTRTSRADSGKDAWIMVKRRDERADPALDAELSGESAVSGRTIEQVAADAKAERWTRAKATWTPPMLAEHSKRMPTGDGWVYERKLDGLRCIAVRNGDDVQLWSRGHQAFTQRFARIADELRGQPIDNFVVDGEVVALEGDKTSFAALQRHGATAEPIFFVFDVLHVLGQDTTALPFVERKPLLAKGFEETPHVRLTDAVAGDPAELLSAACEAGWEGLMAKRSDGRYVSGRSSLWLKLKCSASQELVIGGWTEPKGSRHGFGALLVGYFDDQGLRYAGKVGTGFDADTLTSLHAAMAARERTDSPFVDRIREKGAHWTEPELIANVAFAEWTGDAKLRHPRFEGLRTDKDPRTVIREG